MAMKTTNQWVLAAAIGLSAAMVACNGGYEQPEEPVGPVGPGAGQTEPGDEGGATSPVEPGMNDQNGNDEGANPGAGTEAGGAAGGASSQSGMGEDQSMSQPGDGGASDSGDTTNNRLDWGMEEESAGDGSSGNGNSGSGSSGGSGGQQ